MKLKNKNIRFLISICSCMIFCCLIFSACSSDNISAKDNSIVMIKNATMATYGTGFAVGVPGKSVDTILTAYSVIATPNGAAPKTAEVMIDETEMKLTASVAYYDSSKNIAVLKLPKPSKTLKPLLLKENVKENEKVYVRGFDGTGNITSDFEKFNTHDIIQYAGNISTYAELNSMVVYQYSNEFNRALVGAPAMDQSGNVVGMCAYSIDKMHTYSQYILSTEEIIGCFVTQNVEFMTDTESLYRNITVAALIAGVLSIILILLFTFLGGKNKNKKNSDSENNLTSDKDTYITITGGSLIGQSFKLETKISIGRDGSRCEVVYPINEPGISAVHCTIKREGSEVYLVDEYSSHGTFLEGGIKITPSVPYKIENEHFAFYIADPRNRIEIGNKKEN